jgi:hypothetical protein
VTNANTILVVDDNVATRYSTSRVLRAAGFSVLEAATGRDALAQAEHRPDLVILDVDLPDIDGFEVCRRLRSLPSTARTPVLHLSAAFTRDLDKVHGLDAGADGYMTHPVEPPVLVATINAFLRTRRAEDALRASEARFMAVFDRTPTGIALLDMDTVLLDVNPALCRHLGRDREAIVGHRLGDLLRGQGDTSVRTGLDVIRTADAWVGVLPVHHDDGRVSYLEWNLSRHSVPDTCLAMTTDITERLAIEAEREHLLRAERTARSEAERANRLKDDFLAVLSHELRTPLNAVVGWSHVLRIQTVNAGADVARAVSAIERNARVQAQLIADLLDVSRIASGKLQLDRQCVDPGPVVEGAVAALAAAAAERGVSVTLHIESGAGHVFWDQARLMQVVWNLLDNAIKFSPREAEVRVSLARHGECIVLAVADAGRGIASEFLPHLFERFRQQDAGTTRSFGGLGLGLSVVKQLVDAHGDEISVESEGEGRGATFTVRMAIATGVVEGEAVEHQPAASLGQARVLVVEDDPDARILVARLLRDAGADVRDVPDTEGALAEIAAWHPQLLVSDIGMRGQDGYDLMRQVRARGFDASALPAIALTAYAGDEDRARALAAGYQHHLVKPVHPTRLVALAERLLGSAAASALPRHS